MPVKCGSKWLKTLPFFLSVADVKQDMLETIVPKREHDSVMVVLGEHRGQVSRGSFFPQDVCVPIGTQYLRLLVQVGRILQRDKNKCRAMVQLDRYEEKVFTLDYDCICHYVGVTDH